MATGKAPTKAEFLAALNKKGINSLEDLVDRLMPETDETGGYIATEFVDDGAYFSDMRTVINKYKGNTDLVGLGHVLSGSFLALYADVYMGEG